MRLFLRMGKRLLPFFVLAAAVLVFFNKMALTNLILGRGDTLLYFYPYWQAAADALRAGRVPLWNPDLFMGAPFLANSQVGFFYPLNWPLWLLLPTPYAVSAAILLHLFIAGVGTYLAGRRWLGLGRWPAVLAAILFALGGYLTAQVEHVNQLQGLAWLPWFFALWPEERQAGKHYYVKLILVVGGLFSLQFLAGHTQSVFITGVGLAIWLLSRMDWSFVGQRVRQAGDNVENENRANSGLSNPYNMLAVVAGGVLALVISAVQLLPTLELVGQSSRQGGLAFNEVVSFSLHPLLASRALLPGYGQSLFSEYVAFLPLTALVLAFIGGWQWRQERAVRPFLVLTLLGIFLALGQFNPLYYLLGRLPGFNLFRVPARWLVLYGFGMALLAGYGLELVWQRWQKDWQDRAAKPFRIAVILLLALMIWSGVSVLLSRIVPVGPEAPAEWPSIQTIAGWVIELVLLGIFLTQRREGAKAQSLIRSSFVIFIGVVLFLGSRSLPYNNLTTPEAYFDLRPSVTRLQAAGLAGGECGPEAAARGGCAPIGPKPRFLSLSRIFFDPGDLAEIETIYDGVLPEAAFYDYTIAIKQKEIIAPNLPLAYGLSSLDGFDGGLLPLENYTEVTTLLLPDGVETTDGRLRENLPGIPEAKWLDLFGAQFIITDKVGDSWQEVAPGQTAYFDLQHQQQLEIGQQLPVAFVPEFEATALFLMASEPGLVDIMTSSGKQSSLTPESAGQGLWSAELPDGAAVLEKITLTAVSAPWQVNALTLVNTKEATFQSLVPGNYRLIHSGDVKIYENLDVLPRAFMVYEWLYRPSVSGGVSAMEASDEAAEAEADFDPSQQAVIVADGPERLLGQGQGQVDIISYEPERIELTVDSNETGLLVLTEANYPGWQAEVDGQGVEIQQTDGLFRGVVVPAGAHEVVFVFRPLSYQAGLVVSLISLILFLVGLIFLIKSRVSANQRA